MLLGVLQKNLGYSFEDIHLLKQALMHRSARGPQNYERLEYLGDALFNSIVSKWLFHNSQSSEGLLSQQRSRLVCEDALVQYASQWKLTPHIQCSPDLVGTPSIIADSFEAICAAIFLDSSWEELYHVMMQNFSATFQELLQRLDAKDFKTQLQEYTQEKQQSLPEYQLIRQTGSEHQPLFEISCRYTKHTTVGVGPSKKQAQQKAAQAMLSLLSSLN